MKYIDADLLREEIKFIEEDARKVRVAKESTMNQRIGADGQVHLCQKLNLLIDSLQQEQPSLPSNLDEVAEKYANKEYPDEVSCSQWGTGDYEPPIDMEYPREIAKDSFKARAEWMAGQGAIKYWMAKDKDGHLLISNFKPYKRPTGYLDTDSFKWINISPVLSRELFPDIKLGDSPVEVIFQIRKKN